MNTPSSQSLVPPKILLDDIVSLEVKFFNFNGEEQAGIIEVHTSIQQEVVSLFNYIHSIQFPLTSVQPISVFDDSDDASMQANNSYAFGFRTVALDTSRISSHGYGMAIDLNPAINPYINGDTILPPDSPYIPGNLGVFDAQHPVVTYFRKLGFQWGGDWNKPYYDYHHFQKPLPIEYQLKYDEEIKKILQGGRL